MRETLGLYLLGVAAFCLLLSIDFLSLWAKFLIDQQAPLASVGRLMLFILPRFLHLSLPIAIVFGVLLATGRLAKDSELKAAYSLGASPRALLLPLVGLGLLVSGLSVVNNGWLEPLAERAYQRTVDDFFSTLPTAEVQSNASFRLEGEGVFFAARIRREPGERERAELRGVLVVQPDGTTYTATTGVWNAADRSWVLHEAERVGPDGARGAFGRVVLPFDLDAGAEETIAAPSELTLSALVGRLEGVRRGGGEVRELRFLIHRRLADAFAAAVFVLIAGALGLAVRDRAAGLAWTIALLVAFWALWTLSESFYERAVLGPVEAAWLTPLAAALAGAALAARRLRG